MFNFLKDSSATSDVIAGNSLNVALDISMLIFSSDKYFLVQK